MSLWIGEGTHVWRTLGLGTRRFRPQDDSNRKLDKPKLQGGTPRLRRPQRDQVEMQFLALDEMLDSNHPVRAIWSAVLALDLGQWLGRIQAVEGRPGRNAVASA